MPFFARTGSASRKNDPQDEGGEDQISAEEKKDLNDMVSDDEIKDLIKPELFTLNVPAIMEIFFGLFLLLYAIMLIGLSMELGMGSDLGRTQLAQGIVYIVLMLLSFIVGYGLIMKKKYGAMIGIGKGIVLIIYFVYSVIDYRSLMLEARSRELIMFSDLNEASYYEANMYANIMLLVFVLLLTLLIFRIIYNEGRLRSFFSNANNDNAEV